MRKSLLLLLFALIVSGVSGQNKYAALEKIMAIKDLDKRIQAGAIYFHDIAEFDYGNMADHGRQLYALAKKANDKHLQGIALCGLSYASFIIENSEMSLDYALKAVKIAEQLENPSLTCFAKGALALNYNNSKKALALYHDALHQAKKAKFHKAEEILTANIGMTYLYHGEYLDSAQIYLQRTEQLLVKNTRENSGQLLAYFSLGNVYMKLGNPKMANVFYAMGKSAIKFSKSSRFISISYSRLANIKLTEKDIDSAAYYAKKAVAAIENTQLLNLRMFPAKMLSEIYHGKDDTQAMKYAAIFMEESAKLNDSKKLQQTQLMMFNEELRQQSIADDKLKAAKERRHTIQYAIIATGIITFFIAFLLLSRTVIANEKWISFLSILALLLVFEFVNLLIHPFLGNLTHHSPILMLLCMVILASLLIPLHHKLEHFIKHKLIEKNKAIRLAAAKKTIEQLENDHSRSYEN